MFSIVIVIAFALTTVVLFSQGMADAPGRSILSPDVDPSPTDDLFNTSTPTPSASPDPVLPDLPPRVQVRGIWVGAAHYQDREQMKIHLEMLENTTLNAIVLDVKNEAGQVIHLSNDDFAAWRPEMETNVIQDHTNLVTELKSLDIYTIARIVCFKDPIGTVRQPQNAIQHRNGNVWRDAADIRWLNPFNKANWEYIAQIGLEAAKMGFDEIQLDYVRFPVSGALSDRVLPDADEFAPIIAEFAGFMRDTMHAVGVRVSADIFAISGISNNDSRLLGQDVQMLLPQLDAISPMIYPSHFANEGPQNTTMGNGVGSFINGVLFTRPALEPHGVVYNTLQHFRRHIDDFITNNPDVPIAEMRPFLQGSNDNYLGEGFWKPYGPDEFRAQMQAVYDAGFHEWIFWNNVSDYTFQDRYQAFLP
ncbi:MAG: putative glycoside hydrolase [Oscillospiraceae bacterium]|nr:putative glycoside hydrolase [Oscillospiraceae bacterium]